MTPTLRPYQSHAVDRLAAILDALAWLAETARIEQPRRGQVALVARVSSTSSGFEKNLSTMNTEQLIWYPGQGLVAITPTGRALARDPDRAVTVEQLQESLYGRVSSSQAVILRVLVGVYPKSLTREECAERAAVSAESSGFEKNLSTLRTLGLADYPERGRVAASPVLFLEGR